VFFQENDKLSSLLAKQGHIPSITITTARLHVCMGKVRAAVHRKHSAIDNSEQRACEHNSNNEVIHFVAACPCNRVNYFRIMYSTTAHKLSAPYKRKLSH